MEKTHIPLDSNLKSNSRSHLWVGVKVFKNPSRSCQGPGLLQSIARWDVCHSEFLIHLCIVQLSHEHEFIWEPQTLCRCLIALCSCDPRILHPVMSFLPSLFPADATTPQLDLHLIPFFSGKEQPSQPKKSCRLSPPAVPPIGWNELSTDLLLEQGIWLLCSLGQFNQVLPSQVLDQQRSTHFSHQRYMSTFA